MSEKYSEKFLARPERNPDMPPEAFSPSDAVVVRPLKQMTIEEIAAEAKKQGLRPLNSSEIIALVNSKRQEVRIEPKAGDIEPEYRVIDRET